MRSELLHRGLMLGCGSFAVAMLIVHLVPCMYVDDFGGDDNSGCAGLFR